MKKWLQNLSGAVIASLLTVTLSGKAYASEPGEQTALPDSPPQINEYAPQAAPSVPAQDVSSPGSTTQTGMPSVIQTPDLPSASAAPASAETAAETLSAQNDATAPASDAPAPFETSAVEALSIAEIPDGEVPVELSAETPVFEEASGIPVVEVLQQQPAADDITKVDVDLQPVVKKGAPNTAIPTAEILAAPKLASAPMLAVNPFSEPDDTVTAAAVEENDIVQRADSPEDENEIPVTRGVAAKSVEL